MSALKTSFFVFIATATTIIQNALISRPLIKIYSPLLFLLFLIFLHSYVPFRLILIIVFLILYFFFAFLKFLSFYLILPVRASSYNSNKSTN
jgi:hypothetical protein